MWQSSQQTIRECWLRYRRIAMVLVLGLVVALAWLGFSQLMTSQAAPVVTITPITWDVLGLDSQIAITSTIGPSSYPVGARICSDTSITNMVATLVWSSATPNTNINITGPVSYTVGSFPANTCADFYYTVDVARTAAAFDTSRLYSIQVTGQGISTPISNTVPGLLYVERLNRYLNPGLLNRKLAGPTLVNLGGLYTYTLNIANTTPISYSQLVNGFTQSLPVFRLVRVAASYTIPITGTNNSVYADACGWQRDPYAVNARSCIGPPPTAFPNSVVGGDMAITYTVNVINTGNTVLTPLIYGYVSPSSGGPKYQYEYNAGTTLGVQAVNPNPPTPSATITKSVSPTQAAINEILTYTIVVKNNGTANLTNMTVTDNFPLALDLLSASSTTGTVSSNTTTKNVTVTAISLTPNQTATITVQCRVNSSATVNANISNTATLSYSFNNTNYTASSNASFKVTGTSLPPTGGMEIEQSSEQSAVILPVLLAVLLGLAGIATLILGSSARSRQSEWAGWFSKTGAILLFAALIFGVIGWAINRSSSQPASIAQSTEATAIPEVDMAWLSATEAPWENFPASNSPDELDKLPDFPIPTPDVGNTAAPGEPIPDTSPVVRIRIPALGVDTVVKYVPYDGQSWAISGLKQEVAWMGDTSWPGLGGNTGFAGHVTLSDGSNGPFRTLPDLANGELVVLYTENNVYTYKVRELRVVEDEDLSILKPSGNPEITLITCTDWDPEQNTYLRRLVVYSDLVSTNPITLQDRGN